MSEVVVKMRLRSMHTSFPAQWQGTTEDGRLWHIRYRFGELTMHLEDGEDELNCWMPPECVKTVDPKGWAGEMSDEEVIGHLKEFGVDATV